MNKHIERIMELAPKSFLNSKGELILDKGSNLYFNTKLGEGQPIDPMSMTEDMVKAKCIMALSRSAGKLGNKFALELLNKILDRDMTEDQGMFSYTTNEETALEMIGVGNND